MTDLTINPYTRQPYSEFATRYLACDRCHEAKVREGDGETTCEECKAIIAEDAALHPEPLGEGGGL